MYFVETMAAIFVLCKTTISALYYACTSVACPLNDAASYEINEETMERKKNYFNFHDEFMRSHKKYIVVVFVVRKQFMIGV